MRPIIGITCFMRDAVYGNWHRHAAILPSAYVSVIGRVGGTPLIIPPSGGTCDLLKKIDGLVISGGPDINPEMYGEDISPLTNKFHPEQDAAEIDLINKALEMDMPLLGVCRGMQILSVIHGGKLHQHLDSTPGFENHGGYDGVSTEHGVDVKENTLLQTLMGDSITVNSTHHQGVADAGDLTVTGNAKHDGLIEAVERVDKKFCLGVQWHPERIGHDNLYSGLVEAARG